MTNTLPTKKRIPSIIETEHLLLRTPRIEDAFALSDLASTNEAFANATVGQDSSTLETACTAIVRMLEEQRTSDGSWWIVIEKDSGRVIGLTGFNTRNAGHGPMSALATDVRGRGYAKELVSVLLHCSAPMPALQNSISADIDQREEHEFTPPTRWYWHNKPNRLARPKTRRCA